VKVFGGIWGILAVAALLMGALAASYASGQSGDESIEELRERFCGEEDPCRILNTVADPSASNGEPVPLSEALAEQGQPAEECPQAEEAYEAAGQPVDAFLGPCPPASELPGQGGSP
jgi:hypothetical protein